MSRATIFRNIKVVTPDNGEVKVFNDFNVSVYKEKITYVGSSVDDAVKSVPAETTIDYYDGKNRILLPSFVNSHTHLAMTLMRNHADDTILHKWLFDMIFPVEAKLRPVDINNGNLLGIAEIIRSGTGSCANMYMNYENATDAQLALDTGIKINTVFNGGKLDNLTGKFNIDKNYFNSFFNKYNNAGNGRVKCGVLVHSIYLYNEDYYYGLASLASENKTFIHVHVSETEREVNECIEKYNMRPPEILEKMGIFDVPCLAAHCVYLNDNDIRIFKEKNVTVAHNPVSNLKLGSGFADIKKLIDAGVNVSIGTDGPASNNNLDLYKDIRIASYLAKGLHKDASVVSASEILKSATVNGAKGLCFENTGEIRTGFDADIQIISTDNISMTPLGDPLAAIVYSADSNCVESLMVSGKMLMRKRELLTIDEEKVVFEANKSTRYLYG